MKAEWCSSTVVHARFSVLTVLDSIPGGPNIPCALLCPSVLLSNCWQNCRSAPRVNRNRNRHRGGGGWGGDPPPHYIHPCDGHIFYLPRAECAYRLFYFPVMTHAPPPGEMTEWSETMVPAFARVPGPPNSYKAEVIGILLGSEFPPPSKGQPPGAVVTGPPASAG